MDRIVWDPFSDRTYLVSPGRFPRVANGHLGMVLTQASRGSADGARIAQQYPRTIARATEAGWLTPRTVMRTVPQDPHLRRVQIEVGLRCNLRCAYCYSMSGPKRTDQLTSEQVLELVDAADRLGVVEMDFTGGELMLDPEWGTYVRRARSHGMAVTIHTNGTILTESRALLLKELGVAAVQISLDSHLPEIHDASRGSKGALKRTLRGIDHAYQAGLPVRLALMAQRRNIDTLDETIVFLQQRYPKATLNVDRVIATGGAVESGDALTSEEFWTFLAPHLSSSVRAGKICESPGLREYEPECGVAYSYVYVTAQGEIAACPTMTSRESPQFAAPRLDTHDLASAWYDSAFFTSFRYTNCENVTRCVAGKVCGGGCRSNAYVEFGSVHAPDVIACNQHKNSTKVFVDFPTRYRQGEYGIVTAS